MGRFSLLSNYAGFGSQFGFHDSLKDSAPLVFVLGIMVQEQVTKGCEQAKREKDFVQVLEFSAIYPLPQTVVSKIESVRKKVTSWMYGSAQ